MGADKIISATGKIVAADLEVRCSGDARGGAGGQRPGRRTSNRLPLACRESLFDVREGPQARRRQAQRGAGRAFARSSRTPRPRLDAQHRDAVGLGQDASALVLAARHVDDMRGPVAVAGLEVA